METLREYRTLIRPCGQEDKAALRAPSPEGRRKNHQMLLAATTDRQPLAAASHSVANE